MIIETIWDFLFWNVSGLLKLYSLHIYVRALAASNLSFSWKATNDFRKVGFYWNVYCNVNLLCDGVGSFTIYQISKNMINQFVGFNRNELQFKLLVLI